MARISTNDPLDKFRWTVSIDGFTKSGFATCGVPSYNINSQEYPEGGSHVTPKRIIESVTYKPVELSRGVTTDTSINLWATAFIDLVTNNASSQNNSTSGLLGFAPAQNNQTYPFSYRRNVTISHINRIGQADIVYTLYNAFPIEYQPASDFDAKADDGVSIERMVLAYDSFDVQYAGLSGALANIGVGGLLSSGGF